MLLIYCQQISPRLEYIVRHIFEENFHIDWHLTDQWEQFQNSQEPKIIYGQPVDNYYCITSNQLLFESNIHAIDFSYQMQGDTPVCFVSQQQDLLGFDVFAACFYFLSRYEEYLPSKRDKLNRYLPENSWAVQHHCLDKALVERWIQLFKNKLLELFPEINIQTNIFSFQASYDIDIAYCYQNKGLLLSLLGSCQQILTRQWSKLKDRWDTCCKKIPDPYCQFEYLQHLHEQYHLKGLFFFLVAEHRSRYNKNTSIKNKNFQELIKTISKNNLIGLHASVQDDYYTSIEKEIAFLQQTSNQIITSNRMHYLHLQFLPDTYQTLTNKHIQKDYSMGYVDAIGFRSGSCRSFLFFDLSKNQSTPLRVFPLPFMENAFENLDNEDFVVSHIKQIIDEYYQYNGQLVSLFHNQSFGKYASKDWRYIYETILAYIDELCS